MPGPGPARWSRFYGDQGLGNAFGAALTDEAGTPAPPEPEPPTGDIVDVFRFFNTDAGGHFFTTNIAERDFVLQNLPSFNFEGVGFEAFAADATVEGADEVFRFFNTTAGGHFFTTNEAERDFVLQNLPNFNFEGVSFQAFEDFVEGTIPVYRFFNTDAGGHFFTSNEAERDFVLQNLPNFNFEGVGFFASTIPSPVARAARSPWAWTLTCSSVQLPWDGKCRSTL